jgi:hypothetical protein
MFQGLKIAVKRQKMQNIYGMITSQLLRYTMMPSGNQRIKPLKPVC